MPELTYSPNSGLGNLGEQCTFSAPSPSEGWAQHFVAPLKSEIHFVPAFFIDPTQLSTGDAQGNGGFGGVTDGDFNACYLLGGMTHELTLGCL